MSLAVEHLTALASQVKELFLAGPPQRTVLLRGDRNADLVWEALTHGREVLPRLWLWRRRATSPDARTFVAFVTPASGVNSAFKRLFFGELTSDGTGSQIRGTFRVTEFARRFLRLSQATLIVFSALFPLGALQAFVRGDVVRFLVWMPVALLPEAMLLVILLMTVFALRWTHPGEQALVHYLESVLAAS